MTKIDEPVEEKLVRLKAETAELRPRSDFAFRVMAQIDSSHSAGIQQDWSTQVLRWAKVGVMAASVAAAVLVGAAWNSMNSADQEEALAYGVVEAFE